MAITRGMFVIVTGSLLVSATLIPATAQPAPDGFARLRASGRPTPPGGIGGLDSAYGSVTAVDERSITIQSWFGLGIENMKEADDSGTDRYGLWIRRDPTKPIVLSDPGWEFDCLSYRITPKGRCITLLNGLEVTVKNSEFPIRQFQAVDELIQGAPHPGIPAPGRRQCHLLADVRVKDEVLLWLIGKMGKEQCISVNIYRRAEGRVPPSLHADTFGKLIERCNAYQEHERNGSPIPVEFRRDLVRREFEREDADRRAAEAATPVAPAPRRVIRPGDR